MTTKPTTNNPTESQSQNQKPTPIDPKFVTAIENLAEQIGSLGLHSSGPEHGPGALEFVGTQIQELAGSLSEVADAIRELAAAIESKK
jgi:hypothetical protein